jgi:hypothetical protein
MADHDLAPLHQFTYEKNDPDNSNKDPCTKSEYSPGGCVPRKDQIAIVNTGEDGYENHRQVQPFLATIRDIHRLSPFISAEMPAMGDRDAKRFAAPRSAADCPLSIDG